MRERQTARNAAGEEFIIVRDSSRLLEYIFTCDFVPTQAEGVLDGCHFFFRARGDSLRFAVSLTPGVHPGQMGDGEHGFYRELHGKEIGYLSPEEAEGMIERYADELLREGRAAQDAGTPKALEGLRAGRGRPAGEFPDKLRRELNIPAARPEEKREEA